MSPESEALGVEPVMQNIYFQKSYQRAFGTFPLKGAELSAAMETAQLALALLIAALLEQGADVVAVDELHDQEVAAVLAQADVVDLHDVWVLQSSDRLRFSREPLQFHRTGILA